MPQDLLESVTHLADVNGLGWLPIKYRAEFHLLFIKAAHSALHDTKWSSYLTLQRRQVTRNLQFNTVQQLIVPLENGTFQDSASRLSNNLPYDISLEINVKTFARNVFRFLRAKGESELVY